LLEALARWWRRSRGRGADAAGGAGNAGAAVGEVDLVEQARREWQAARSLFENVSDPELIDHAIHRMTAAERRYMFLIKEARRSGIVEDGLGLVLADPRRDGGGVPAGPAPAGPAPSAAAATGAHPETAPEQQRPA